MQISTNFEKLKIADAYSDEGLMRYALKLTGNKFDADELISKCVEQCLIRRDKIRKVQADGKFRNYFIVMLKFQFLKSQRNKRQFEPIENIQIAAPNQQTDDIEEKVNDTLSRMHFYSRGLLELYKTDTYRGIAAKTQINYMSVANGINAAKAEFKKIYKPMKIFLAIPNLSGVEYHRLIVPMVTFAKQYGSDVKIMPVNASENEKDQWIDRLPKDTTHVIFNRNISPNIFRPEQALMKIKERTNGKCKIICDVDDYWYLPKNHILWDYYDKLNLSKCIRSNIEMADVVWCTTKELKDEIKSINQNVHIVRNCLDTSEEMWNGDRANKAFDKFLYAGGTTHQHDLKLMRGALKNVDFTIKGTNKQMRKWQRKYFPNAKRLPFSDLTSYGDIYRDYGIVLAPLENNKFNNLKSELKIIEAGTFGRCVLVSDCHPYKNHIKHLKNGIRVKDGEWHKWINWIKGNHDAQREFGNALKDYVVKNYKLNNENKIRFDTM